jgi:hypothetical protein
MFTATEGTLTLRERAASTSASKAHFAPLIFVPHSCRRRPVSSPGAAARKSLSASAQPGSRAVCRSSGRLGAAAALLDGIKPLLRAGSTTSVRACSASTNRRVYASRPGAARMPLCGRAKDKRHCRKPGYSALSRSGANAAQAPVALRRYS